MQANCMETVRPAGPPWPELGHSDLSVLQGRAHAQASCQSERLQRLVSIEQAIISSRPIMKRNKTCCYGCQPTFGRSEEVIGALRAW